MRYRIKLPIWCQLEYAFVRFKRINPNRLCEISPFLKVLRKKYETLIWAFVNGDIYFFTNHKEGMVSVGSNEFILKEIGREVKDIVAIYHNHQSCEMFSSEDMRSFLELRQMGFEGKYCLYIVKTNHLIEATEKEANDLIHRIEAWKLLKKMGFI